MLLCSCGQVTQQAFLPGDTMRETIRQSGSGGAWLAKISEFYFQFNFDTDGVDGSYLHDPMTALAAMDASICEWRTAPVRVVSEGFARGHSLMLKQYHKGDALAEPSFAPDEPENPFDGLRPVEIALGVDAARAIRDAVELLSFSLGGDTARL